MSARSHKICVGHHINSSAGDPAAALKSLGGAQLILATASDSKAMSAIMGGLATRGRMVVVGVGAEAIQVSPLQLLFSRYQKVETQQRSRLLGITQSKLSKGRVY